MARANSCRTVDDCGPSSPRCGGGDPQHGRERRRQPEDAGDLRPQEDLTEAAKKDADVEIGYQRRTYTIGAVAGRTIRRDGTNLPFTAKPFDKLIAKTQGSQYQAKVFSLPDVQVGSIIEYRYLLRYQDTYTIPPTWYLQGKYFIHKAHFRFTPLVLKTGEVILDSRQSTSLGLAWVTILPPGVAVKFVAVPRQ